MNAIIYRRFLDILGIYYHADGLSAMFECLESSSGVGLIYVLHQRMTKYQ
jgi:hypothetical protein